MTINLTKRSFRSMVLGVAAILTLLLATLTGTASAAISDCSDPWPGTKVCFWPDINYGGYIYFILNPAPGTCYNVPPTFNDVASSLYNRSGYTLYIYKDANCVNQWGHYSSYSAYAWIGDFSNDLMTSYKIQ